MKKSLSAKAILMLAVICLSLFAGRPPVNASIYQASPVAAGFTPSEYLPSPGEIVLTRTAAPISDNAGNREFEVEMTIKGTPLDVVVPADIVLVIDLSSSMARPLDGSTGSRLLAIKNAANDFILNVLPDGTDNRLAIVTYSGSPDDGPDNDAWINYSFDDWSGRSLFINKMSLLTTLTTLTTKDGTNMEAGFAKAENVLSQSDSNNKIVIFMTDGEPTFYYDENGETTGDGISFDSSAASQAIGAADRLLRNNDARIFTVGLVADDVLAENVAAVMNPVESGYNDAYFQASDNEGLSSIYAHLARSVDLIACDAALTDQLQPGFNYVEGSLHVTGQPGEASSAEYKQTNSEGDAAAVGGNSAGEIRWRPGLVSNETLTISYRVVADNRLYGAFPISQRAWLEFIPAGGNLFYLDSSFDSSGNPDRKQIELERPVVCVGPLACDDDFYQTEAGTAMIAGGDSAIPCLLDNDFAEIFLSDTEGWQTTEVQAELAQDSVTKLGKISSFSKDGSFKYISNANATGSETFSYNLITTVTDSSGNSQKLSSRADVTIEVIPAAADSQELPAETTFDQIKQTEIVLDESQTGKTGENASSAKRVIGTVLLLITVIITMTKIRSTRRFLE